MPEEKVTAQTTANAEVDSHADVDRNAEDVNEASFTDTVNEQSNEKTADSQKVQQTKAQNSENARRRREAERRAELERVERETREKAILEALDNMNPYTGEEMKDSADVAEFLAMREIEKNGGDPLTDFSKFHKQKERAKKEETEKSEKEREWYENDRKSFISNHPEVDINSLINDEQFKRFADGKVGTVPLSKIYEDFTSFTSEYEKKVKTMAAQRVANQKASPGALSSSSSGGERFYTEEQVRNMSTEAIKKDYERVRASMAKWKK